jgi:hypothetical protein
MAAAQGEYEHKLPLNCLDQEDVRAASRMAISAGFEPAIHAVEIRYSIQI